MTLTVIVWVKVCSSRIIGSVYRSNLFDKLDITSCRPCCAESPLFLYQQRSGRLIYTTYTRVGICLTHFNVHGSTMWQALKRNKYASVQIARAAHI